MNWKQLVTPNLNPTIYQGGVVWTKWLGYCLAYVQSCFSSGWAGRTAWDAWTNYVKYKHGPSEPLPQGVFAILWFSYSKDLDGTGVKNWGHVAIYKNGVIWSSPITQKAAPDIWYSIAELERRYGCKYVGWSEDIGGTHVIQQEESEMPIQDTDNEYQRWHDTALLFRPRRQDISREEFQKNAVGRTWLGALEGLFDGPGYAEARDLIKWGIPAKDDRWDLQIYTGNEQLAKCNILISNLQAQAALSAKQLAQVEAIKAENAELAARELKLRQQAESDQATGNAFIRFLGSLFNKK